jgi:dinuclear metal center YbgI/SA1388 family protein
MSTLWVVELRDGWRPWSGHAGGSIASVTTVAEIQTVLDRLAPSSKAAGWDPVGLQIGDPAAAVSRIGVCHEVTAAIVERVLDEDIDLLVSYHPLLFRPTLRLVAGPGAAGRALALAGAGVSLVVVHTAFDVASGGSADALADTLGLIDSVPFEPLWGPDSVSVVVFAPTGAASDIIDAMARAGAGEVGRYTHCSFASEGTGTFRPELGAAPLVGEIGEQSSVSEVRIEMVAPGSARDRVVAALVSAHPYEEPVFGVYDRMGESGFLGRVGTFTGTFGELLSTVQTALGGTARRSGNPPGDTLRVGVVPGSGASAIPAAAGAGADVLVTGDVKHHDARNAGELGLAVIDPGHAVTERPGVARLYAAVAGEAETVIDLTATDADPWA